MRPTSTSVQQPSHRPVTPVFGSVARFPTISRIHSPDPPCFRLLIHLLLTPTWKRVGSTTLRKFRVMKMVAPSNTNLPLSGLRVLEFAGLAPVPFASLLLTDFGASTLRVDRYTKNSSAPAPDTLTNGKASIALDLKSDAGRRLALELARKADVLLDPFRPGVLEGLGLGPEVLLKENPRLIYARLTGFRRDDPVWRNAAGHDINYLALSGVLSLLGPAGGAPNPPINLLADFAGGGLMCVLGILLALYERQRSGRGQVVDTNMVDGVDYISGFIKGMMSRGLWGQGRGRNLLDGGVPFYGVYKCKGEDEWVSVGALEPQFYKEMVQKMFPDSWNELPDRQNPRNWKKLREKFAAKFAEKSKNEWTSIFAGSDACVVPILTMQEAAERNGVRPPVGLGRTPGKVPVVGKGLKVGQGAGERLKEWGVEAKELEGKWEPVVKGKL